MPTKTNKNAKKMTQQFKSSKGMSKRALVLWITAFAVIGGLVVLKSFAASGGTSYGVSPYSSRRVPTSSSEYSYHWNWGCSGGGAYAFYLYTSGGALKASGSYTANGAGHDIYTTYNNYYAVLKNNSGGNQNCYTSWYDR